MPEMAIRRACRARSSPVSQVSESAGPILSFGLGGVRNGRPHCGIRYMRGWFDFVQPRAR